MRPGQTMGPGVCPASGGGRRLVAAGKRKPAESIGQGSEEGAGPSWCLQQSVLPPHVRCLLDPVCPPRQLAPHSHPAHPPTHPHPCTHAHHPPAHAQASHEDLAQKLYSAPSVRDSVRFSKPKLSRTDFTIEHYAGECWVVAGPAGGGERKLAFAPYSALLIPWLFQVLV